MLSRSSVAAALLAAYAVAVVPALRADPPEEKLVRRIYPVTDLLTTPPDVTCPKTVDPAKTGKTQKPRPTGEDRLIKLIQNEIEPASWSDHGGQGTIDYYPMGGALVVNQTVAIQERIADMLTALRRLQDTEVALDVRILTVSEDVFERIGVDVNTEATTDLGQKVAIQATLPVCGPMFPEVVTPGVQATFLDAKQVQQLLEMAAAADQNVKLLASPTLIIRNGGEGSLICGFHMTALPHVSADRRYVQVALKLDQCDQSPANEVSGPCFATTASIPDGGTVLIGGLKKVKMVRRTCCPPVVSLIPYINRLFTNVGYGHENQLEFVLVTPRIVVAEEKEAPAACSTMQACPPPATACPQPEQAVPTAAGMTLPAPHYLEHLPQYFPPSQYYTLPHEQPNPPPERCVPPPNKGLPPNVIVVQPPASLPEDRVQGRQAGVLAELLKAYDAACAEGKTAEAKKYARAALLIDPMCFSKKR